MRKLVIAVLILIIIGLAVFFYIGSGEENLSPDDPKSKCYIAPNELRNPPEGCPGHVSE